MGMMYGNGSFKGGIDAAVLAYIGDSTLTTSADNLGDAINEHEEDISEIKSNLTEKTKDIATATISSTATTKYTTAGDGWRICMRNGIVSLDMVIDVKSAQSGWTDVGQIPSNFPYPPQVIYFPCNTWASISTTKLDLQITTGGVIKMRAGAVTQYYVHLSW